MLLTVDVGNSHTVSGVFDGKTIAAEWRLKSDRDRTGDELAIRYHSLFQMAGIDMQQVTGFILSSVVPTLETAWMKFAERYLAEKLIHKPISVNHTTKTGITVATENPSEVGADRIVNSAAAWQLCKQKLIVIDFGTAITFDCVNDRQEYLGGAIMPGISISLDALAGRTAKLPRVDIDKPVEKAIGRNSTDAIRSGLMIGFGGMVDRMVERISVEMSSDPNEISIIGTGGMAQLIAPYSKYLVAVDPLLTLKGLNFIFELNVAELNPQ